MATWKPIAGYEGLYAVSGDGQIKSLRRYRVCGRGGRQLIPEQNKMPQLVGSGYFAVILYKDKKAKLHLIHRLVAAAFLTNPKKKPQVNHIDGVKTNNKISNLEWATGTEDYAHAKRTGLRHKGAKGRWVKK